MPVSDHPPPSPPASPPPAKRLKAAEPEQLPFEKVDYSNGLHLAPMVRTGSLPTRLLALEYGASKVWGPEVVDKAVIGAERVVNPTTGVIDYIKQKKSVFSTHPIERPYVIYQIGSSDPQLAVKAALTVQADVAGIDLNCGCPKHFSMHAGMGAALLSNPPVLLSILRALVSALPHKSISCKIRLLPTQKATLELVRQIAHTGVRALTVHCRTREMRSSECALLERLREVREAVEGEGTGVTVIANGDGTAWEEAQKVKGLTGVTSVMIARGAESNPSCFLPSGPLDTETIIQPHFLRLAYALDNVWPNTKFVLAQHTPTPLLSPLSREARRDRKERQARTKSHAEMARVFEMELGEEKGLEGPVGEGLRRTLEERRRKEGEGQERSGEGTVPQRAAEETILAVPEGERDGKTAELGGGKAAETGPTPVEEPPVVQGEKEQAVAA